jgi:1,4-dihydroxy-2-naphthoyl-CoA hydrolase
MEAKCRVARVELTLAQLSEAGDAVFPGLVGVRVESLEEGVVHARLELRPDHMAPNGYLHAGAVVTLADSACGYGCFLSLPEGGIGFTTIELKANFVRSAQRGEITCEARLVHGGRTTQLWDATVRDADGRPMAHFRCTQLVLY